jgi:hypothetical protein
MIKINEKQNQSYQEKVEQSLALLQKFEEQKEVGKKVIKLNDDL